MAIEALDAQAHVDFVGKLDGLRRRGLGLLIAVGCGTQDDDQEEAKGN